ncbi:CRISPR-associated helicase Cas3/CRISPR-associated endonuclease Cas3-HD [Marinitoga piezophila KA3]|uniref:CRISPR-associated helicase Cas3/CRISPR-associated endonuclease Cas3-HD n=1 Tax=Marinitoga piezophila (strain DSM 14283 / JCM 11233 / KA3) TaxID=443254 RepID=H2J400_MARPK|nr:CRISPR-associated helicase/endonuclease Cas3 [Marinitoga piezophila]AEX84728.1 CRISPR-associated helicase Cas3/CRISPR-associated endonuclease Cas3-HD [Marinitoga piezophila KA3]
MKSVKSNENLILAKSDGTTLLEHIEDNIVILNNLKRMLPLLPKITKLDNFWDILFSTIFFHDFGKIHKEFQKYIKGEKNLWTKQRHEIYSIPFIDKLNLDERYIKLIKKVILSHHKSFYELKYNYLKSKEDLEYEYELNWKNKTKFHPQDYEGNLKYNFDKKVIDFYIKKFDELAKKYHISVQLKNEKIKINNIRNPIEEFAYNLEKYNKEEYLQHLLLWGSLKICDHLGSAKIIEIYMFEEKHFVFLDEMKRKIEFYDHQKKCFSIKGSCLLIAPTGSGKTESAIGWVKTQLENKQGRVFYVLPYTASINAMHKRLIKNMDRSASKISNIIGILHGNISHYISIYFEEGITKNENSIRNKKIKKIIKQYKNLLSPLIVCTPFQLLKYFYGVKGFEKGFVFFSGAKLIFDEIHAYDIVTFAQIVVMLEVLKKDFLCDVMIMTATIPTFMQNILAERLNIDNIITADKKFVEKLKRHKIKIVDKNIFDFIDSNFRKIINNHNKIILVCNTVEQSQKVYMKVRDMNICSDNEIVLIHGRFNQHDRNDKEKAIYNQKTKILIGTQTIEVSLDIDYDVMITEPAPIDALLQRFGRVNRNSKKKPAPVYICRKGGEYDHYIYPINKIEKTLEVLNDVDILCEKNIGNLIDEVYPNWNDFEKKEFEDTVSLFRNSLKSLQPFSDTKETEEFYYSKFTNIKVLPACYYSKYINLMELYNFIEAEKLLVNINRNFFYKYIKEGKIEKRELVLSEDEKILKKHSFYIIKCKYNSEVGLINEYEEIKHDINFI